MILFVLILDKHPSDFLVFLYACLLCLGLLKLEEWRGIGLDCGERLCQQGVVYIL